MNRFASFSVLETAEGFVGDYKFLSNFFICPVEVEGLKFTSSEAAYQAFKTYPISERQIFCRMTPGEAKRHGKQVSLRTDWEEVKIHAMKLVLYAKFTQNPDLARRLRDTRPTRLVEYNNWGDQFWGICGGKGRNYLGQLLMDLREQF
jgi:ribA/ribD-fused uncharacterized protein